MSLTEIVILYPIALLVFFIIDMFWLAFVARRLYAQEMKGLIRTVTGNSVSPRWIPAILFYLMFNAGTLFFGVYEGGIERDRLEFAALYGALFGFFTYGTYELTNFAVMKTWSLKLTIIDWIWGTILSASIASVVYIVYTGLF